MKPPPEENKTSPAYLEFGGLRGRRLREGIKPVQLSLKLVVGIFTLDLQRRCQASVVDRQQVIREMNTFDHLESK